MALESYGSFLEVMPCGHCLLILSFLPSIWEPSFLFHFKRVPMGSTVSAAPFSFLRLGSRTSVTRGHRLTISLQTGAAAPAPGEPHTHTHTHTHTWLCLCLMTEGVCVCVCVKRV